ncbi:MAG TPA: DNA-binding domain-containing protein [Vicinamibacteria bacterium]|nr:DNA-binding domain-containing protein [Vicinamibacteria bacterium]
MPPEGASSALGLDRVQRWLQAVIVHPGCVADALASAEARVEVPTKAIEEVVRPSWSLTAVERVEVYHGMYLLRMVEALESDFPAVRHFLGEEAFAELVRDYVERYPSRSYTLNRLGDHLPQFFAEEVDRPDAAFLHDLARAELAATEVFDEEPSPVLEAEALRRVPQLALAQARLRPIDALRLLELRHTVVGHLEAAKHGRPAPRPRRRRSHLAVYRRDYTVLRREMTGDEYGMLSALVAGQPLGEAIGAAALRLRAARREETVFRWFRSWVAEGLFSAIDCEPEAARGSQPGMTAASRMG